MSVSWNNIVRSIVDGYFLKQFRSEDNGVGLFIGSSSEGAPVHVYLARADQAGAGALAKRWASAAALRHANIVATLGHGQTRIDGTAYHFRILEKPDELLSDVLASRALAPEEARAVLESILPALAYLHDHGFTYTDLRAERIVASDERIKLLPDTLAPMPAQAGAAKESVAAESRQVGVTVARFFGGAAAPAPFDSLIRAGSEGRPTADLLHVLNGGELRKAELRPEAPEPVPVIVAREPMPEVRAEPKPVPAPPRPASYSPTPDPDEVEPNRARRLGLIGGVTAAAVALVLFLAMRGGPDANTEKPSSTAAERPVFADERKPSPPAADPRPTPVKPVAPAEAARSRPTGAWSVVAAVYNNYGAASRRAEQLGRKWSAAKPSVFPAEGKGRRYMVVLGSGMSREQADRMRTQARSAGMPRDTYVTRLSF